jgi:hypothetical protein
MLRRQREGRREGRHSPAILLAVSLQLSLMLPWAHCEHLHVRHRSRAVLSTTTAAPITAPVERCVPDDTHGDELLYRCTYNGAADDTRLTALCPNPFIDPQCRCAVAAVSPLTGLFKRCSACEVIEYMDQWSVTYDCSNLWLVDDLVESEGRGDDIVEDDDAAVFEAAGGLDTSSTSNDTSPAPTPEVRLVSQNSRTSPPYMSPTPKKPKVQETDDVKGEASSSTQSTTQLWNSFWKQIVGGG